MPSGRHRRFGRTAPVWSGTPSVHSATRAVLPQRDSSAARPHYTGAGLRACDSHRRRRRPADSDYDAEERPFINGRRRRISSNYTSSVRLLRLHLLNSINYVIALYLFGFFTSACAGLTRSVYACRIVRKSSGPNFFFLFLFSPRTPYNGDPLNAVSGTRACAVYDYCFILSECNIYYFIKVHLYVWA